LRPVSCEWFRPEKAGTDLISGGPKIDCNHQQQDAVPFYKEKGTHGGMMMTKEG
jgi:hypothetical protein